MSRNTCIHCDGDGCDECTARASGDQGLSPTEVELQRTRDELRIALAGKLNAEVAAAEAQRAAAEMKAERDAALAQLALWSREVAA